MATKYVYFFGDGKAEGKGDMKNLLGGKGANLAEMTSIGLPVPAGFTRITSYNVCYTKLLRHRTPCSAVSSRPEHRRAGR